jgi:hypothetical protein
VETSTVVGINSVFVFFLMVLVMFLSMRNVSDYVLVVIGNVFWIVGGSLMYVFWTTDGNAWHYLLPYFIGVAGFPFIAPSNRSLFTVAVASIPELEGSQAGMQAVLSMAASVAGFVTPTLVAVFVLRDPAVVESGEDNHQLTLGVLYIPIGSGLCIALLWYQEWLLGRTSVAEITDDDGEEPSEMTSMMSPKLAANRRRSSITEVNQAFSRLNESARRHSVESMNISVPYMNAAEQSLREKLWEDKKEWESLRALIPEEDL